MTFDDLIGENLKEEEVEPYFKNSCLNYKLKSISLNDHLLEIQRAYNSTEDTLVRGEIATYLMKTFPQVPFSTIYANDCFLDGYYNLYVHFGFICSQNLSKNNKERCSALINKFLTIYKDELNKPEYNIYKIIIAEALFNICINCENVSLAKEIFHNNLEILSKRPTAFYTSKLKIGLIDNDPLIVDECYSYLKNSSDIKTFNSINSYISQFYFKQENYDEALKYISYIKGDDFLKFKMTEEIYLVQRQFKKADLLYEKYKEYSDVNETYAKLLSKYNYSQFYSKRVDCMINVLKQDENYIPHDFYRDLALVACKSENYKTIKKAYDFILKFKEARKITYDPSHFKLLECFLYKFNDKYEDAKMCLFNGMKDKTIVFRYYYFVEYCDQNFKLKDYYPIIDDDEFLRQEIADYTLGIFGYKLDMDNAKQSLDKLLNMKNVKFNNCYYSTFSVYYYFSGNKKKALEYAKLGYNNFINFDDPCSCCVSLLAYYYLVGFGVKKDVKKAFSLVNKAMRMSADNINLVGIMTYAECAILLNKNKKKALRMLTKSSENCINCASLFYMRIKLKKDLGLDYSKDKELLKQSLSSASEREVNQINSGDDMFCINCF